MTKITFKDLKHIPGEEGLPIMGDFFKYVANASKYYNTQRSKFGDVYKSRTVFGTNVVLCGPTANKLILVDEGKFTTNKEAWETVLGELFPNGLMLMDGDQHNYHRNIMQQAFKKDPMQGYLEIMPEIISSGLDGLNGKKKVLAFPYFKNLTLQLAASVFFGLEMDENLPKINKAISDIVAAAAAIPVNLPFTKYRKGIVGRAFLADFFKSILPERRKNPGRDLFSRLCVAKSEEGNQFTDQEIVDHLIFVLMAAHDTTAITLTFMSYFISKYPEWQDEIRRESATVDLMGPLSIQDLRNLEMTGFIMKETLRIHPPLITVARKLEKELWVDGHRIPKNTFVNVVFEVTHKDKAVWSTPDVFDPKRFNKERREELKCPFAYAPFGAGKHHCIGYAFAEMQIKLVITELIKKFRLSVPENYEVPVQDVPLKMPKDDLPIYLETIK